MRPAPVAKQVDLFKQKFPAATPVKKEYMPAFQQLVDSENMVLAKIPVDTSSLD